MSLDSGAVGTNPDPGPGTDLRHPYYCSSAPLGAPCWIDLTTFDADCAQDFYGTVFGWAFGVRGPDYGGYINAAKGGHPVAVA